MQDSIAASQALGNNNSQGLEKLKIKELKIFKKSLIKDSTTDCINEMISGTKVKSKLVDQKQQIAVRLADRFNAHHSLNFFLKVAWKLPENRIEQMAVAATELGRNPLYYFISCAKKELETLNNS